MRCLALRRVGLGGLACLGASDGCGNRCLLCIGLGGCRLRGGAGQKCLGLWCFDLRCLALRRVGLGGLACLGASDGGGNRGLLGIDCRWLATTCYRLWMVCCLPTWIEGIVALLKLTGLRLLFAGGPRGLHGLGG